ncbi:MAG: hypothetical protein GF364_11720 [Candidatus Lokiarchaeota archaeon]|nr:hypothetical protein [Candidatus Lokiarchaeota archaeon]
MDEFINEKIANSRKMDHFTGIGLKQRYWLTESILDFWIKIETFYLPTFFVKDSYQTLRMESFSKKYKLYESEEAEQFFLEYDEWRDAHFKDFMEKINSKDMQELFSNFLNNRKWELERGDFNGMETILDILVFFPKSKLKEFTSNQNLLVNLLQIVQTLIIFANNFKDELGINLLPEEKWWQPKYYFESQEELNKVKLNRLIYYHLLPDNQFYIIYEGISEEKFLSIIKEHFYSRYLTSICLLELGGKAESSRILKILKKDLKIKHTYAILDADTETYAEGKKNEWIGKGFTEDQFEIFYPDFITANFNSVDIVKALVNYIEPINIDKIENKKDPLLFSEEMQKELGEKLKNAKIENQQFEKVLDVWMQENWDTKLKKSKFADCLAISSMVDNRFIQLDKINKLSFSKHLFQFFDNIINPQFKKKIV